MLRPRFGVFVGAWRRATPVLDTPRVPERLVRRQSEFGAVPERLAPVFRDRDELATSTNLGETLRHALQQSANLVVICSPAKANLRLAQGRYEEARTLAVAARAILERDMPDDSWQVGAAKAVEGAALSRLRRYVEAEPLLKSSIPALGDSTIPGLQQATRQRLVELYMAWGRPHEADGFRWPGCSLWMVAWLCTDHADAAKLINAAILSVHGKGHIMRRLYLICMLAFAVPGITDAADAGPSVAPQRAVLVTGASSGIGRKITERLAAQGYFVYAGARKENDLRELDAIENVESIRLDVTNPQEIAAAVETVRKAGRGLHGLVNNAGVAVVGPLMEAKEDDLRFVFDVNVFGPYRVTKAFAPLILESGGRIITISSIAGILSRPPLGAYSMSKHAIEAFGDALAEELEPRGVKVSLIEPGNYRSEISRNAAVRMGLGPDAQMADRSRFKEPDEVAEAVLHALFDANPKRRYLVVPDAREAEITITKAIEELVQLNERQPFSYDRDELVKMLDAALGRK